MLKTHKNIFLCILALFVLLSAQIMVCAETRQISATTVQFTKKANLNDTYVLQVFAPTVKDPENWVPGFDDTVNAKQLIYVKQGIANIRDDYNNVIIKESFEVGDYGTYTVLYTVNGQTGKDTVEFKEYKIDDRESGSSSSVGGGLSITDSSKPVTVTPTIPMDIYVDMDNHIWARNAVINLTNNGIVSGKGENKFAPNDKVTREEFVKMLVCAFPKYNVEIEDITFADVDKSAWYYDYIKKGISYDITKGYNDTVFGVGDNITRQDMAVMVYRAALSNYEAYEETSSFNDEGEIAEYAKKAVAMMSEKGIINGKGDNMFAPKDTATRAEAAKIIYETMQVVF